MENHFNCIYCYTNKINDKKYIGQAKDFLIRHKQHFNHAHNPKSPEYDMYFHKSIRKRTNHDFKKYEEIYTIEILKEDLKDYEDMNYWERYFIKKFDLLAKNGKGYNSSDGGGNGNCFAGKTEEEMKEVGRKMSETYQNKSDEEKAEHHRKISETWQNKSDEEKAERGKKISKAYQNKSDEEKAEHHRKISEIRKEKGLGKGESNPMYNIHRYGKDNPNLGELTCKIDKDTLEILDIKYNFEYIKNGFDGTGISKCCKGKLKTTGSYIFKYLSDCTDEQINEYIIKNKQIPVERE